MEYIKVVGTWDARLMPNMFCPGAGAPGWPGCGGCGLGRPGWPSRAGWPPRLPGWPINPGWPTRPGWCPAAAAARAGWPNKRWYYCIWVCVFFMNLFLVQVPGKSRLLKYAFCNNVFHAFFRIILWDAYIYFFCHYGPEILHYTEQNKICMVAL